MSTASSNQNLIWLNNQGACNGWGTFIIIENFPLPPTAVWLYELVLLALNGIFLHAFTRALDVCLVAVYMAFVHHGSSSRGKLALDNKWSSLGISDRDRFSTWQHISDDVAFTLAKSLSLCSFLLTYSNFTSCCCLVFHARWSTTSTVYSLL